MKRLNFKALLGVAGVNHLESDYAIKIGHRFEWLVLVALFAVFVQLLMLYSGESLESFWFSLVIWSVFALELVVNLFNVRDRSRYLRENWMNLFIVILAFPWLDYGSDWAVIIRSLRLVLFLRFISGFFRNVLIILKSNRFGQILLAFAFIIIGAGGIFSYLEERSFSDGVWYAVVTITTVGYGDVVPLTKAGHIFGVILILFGVVFFSLVAANIAAFLIGSDQRKSEADLLEYMSKTEDRLAQQSVANEKHVERLMTHFSNELADLKRALEKERKN
ncbi:potassium channel family protein [Thiomicrorhabdus arctica]|jgi:voltage-gated potassium channel|uniref:potassium channel family protein n=1 Tax=Thiomicrorhabdus arctica TaxID=131540 RepID=UPI00036CD703|nr:potassium channel family protein [Thiomicrorhabdus arctica]